MSLPARYLVVVFFGLLLRGTCSDESGTEDTRPPLEDCPHGLFWAECGGGGDPVLGCDRETCECRWFAGDTTALGYAESDCPVADPCCHERWPFSDFAPASDLLGTCQDSLPVLAQGAVTRASANDVTVSADLVAAPLTVSIRCTGIFNGCPGTGGMLARVGEAMVLSFGDSIYRFLLEVVPTTVSGELGVRLYRITAPLEGPMGPSCWGTGSVEDLPLTGSLHVNTMDLSDPEAFHGRLEATTFNAVELIIEW